MEDQTPTPKSNLSYRAAPIQKKADGPATWDEDSRSVEVSGASENPVDVFDYDRYEMVKEVLLMSGLEDLPRQLPLLDAHSRYSTASVVGSFRDLSKSDGQLLGRAYFSGAESVRETALKVKEGHITDFSVGYRVIESAWVPAGQRQLIMGRSFEGPVKVVTRWRAKELSVVPIGADESSKARAEVKIISENPIRKDGKAMDENERAQIAEQIRKDLEKEYQSKARADVEQGAKDAVNEMREIIAIGESHGMRELADQAMKDGRSLKEFKDIVLAEMGKRGAKQVDDPGGRREIGLSDKERKQFSFMNALRYLAHPGDKRFRDAAGFEIECSRAVEDQSRRTPKGIFVPADVLRQPFGQRDMSTKTGAAGGYLVDNVLASGSFIDSLENAMVVKALGAIMLRDLVGDLSIPKQTGGATAYWIGEGGDVTESQQALGQVALRAKSVGAFTDITRKLMLQSSIDIEAFVRNDLALRLALAIDLAALAGTGANGQPLGVLTTTGIGSVTLGTANTPTFGEVVDVESQIAIDNALVGNMSYTSNATIAGKMKQTSVDSGSGRFILEKNEVNGYRYLMSNQVTAKYLLFGNWRDLVIGEWSGIDINVDTATLSKSGGVRIVVIQDVDVAVRHAESFAYGYKA